MKTFRVVNTFYVVGVLDAKQSDGIGWWTDGNKVYEDPILLFDNIQEALKAGWENRQECILEVSVKHPDSNGYLTYAKDLTEDLRIGDAFAEGKTTGLTRLFQPLDVGGLVFSTFTVADSPIDDCSYIPCRYRFLYTNEVEGRFTYYLNLLIAKTQKAGRIFLYNGREPFTVRIGRFAFVPDEVSYEVPAIRFRYGNDDDLLYSVAFTANGRTWGVFRGLPQQVDDELGQTFKVKGKSLPHLLRKVVDNWAKMGGSAYIGESPSPYATINVKVGEEWLNLLP